LIAVNGRGALRTLPRERLIDRATEAIKTHILDNRLKGGDRLPSESDLARTFGISRNVVRQAVSSLETLGIVRVAHGRGIYVADVVDTDVFRQLAAWIDASDVDDREYVQARSIFERGIFELIVENATDGELDHLVTLAAALEATTSTDDFQRGHDEFHHACLAATGNRFLMTLGTILYRFFWSLLSSGPRVRQIPVEEMRTSHTRVARLLRERRADQIPAIVRLHLGIRDSSGEG
jgi:GntR family transcriptional regulator, transcriptional repressor for pyruvate dehydrogenase complex